MLFVSERHTDSVWGRRRKRSQLQPDSVNIFWFSIPSWAYRRQRKGSQWGTSYLPVLNAVVKLLSSSSSGNFLSSPSLYHVFSSSSSVWSLLVVSNRSAVQTILSKSEFYQLMRLKIVLDLNDFKQFHIDAPLLALFFFVLSSSSSTSVHVPGKLAPAALDFHDIHSPQARSH